MAYFDDTAPETKLPTQLKLIELFIGPYSDGPLANRHDDDVAVYPGE